MAQMLWKGKTVADCEESELREIIEFMVNGQNHVRDLQMESMKTELERVKKENERLWSAVGSRA